MIKNIFWVVAVFVIFVGFVLYFPTQVDNFKVLEGRYDIGIYQDIADHGYHFEMCQNAEWLGFPCGNIGWFPLWPLFLRFVSAYISSAPVIKQAIPGLLFFLSLLMFWRVFEILRVTTRQRIFAFVFLIFAPCSFYFLTGFPYSLLLLLAAIYLKIYFDAPKRFRWLTLSGLAFLMGLTYPSAFLFALIPVINEYFDKDEGGWVRFRRILPSIRAGLPFVLATIAFVLYLGLRYDNLSIYPQFQAKYHRTWEFPIWPIFKNFTQLTIFHFENFSFFWSASALILTAGALRHREMRLFWIFTCVVIFFSPATGSMGSVQRHYLIAYPFLGLLLAVSDEYLLMRILLLYLSAYVNARSMIPLYTGGHII